MLFVKEENLIINHKKGFKISKNIFLFSQLTINKLGTLFMNETQKKLINYLWGTFMIGFVWKIDRLIVVEVD